MDRNSERSRRTRQRGSPSRARWSHSTGLMGPGSGPACSLISFGFTIDKFFQYLRTDTRVAQAEPVLSPRGVALVLIGLGIGALLLATLDYRWQRKALAAEYQEYGPFRFSIPATVATLISGLGIRGFVLVFLRQ